MARAFPTPCEEHTPWPPAPDPREDLSGMDVARKSLILARTLGMRLDISDIRVEPLFPAQLSYADPQQFLAQFAQT